MTRPDQARHLLEMLDDFPRSEKARLELVEANLAAVERSTFERCQPWMQHKADCMTVKGTYRHRDTTAGEFVITGREPCTCGLAAAIRQEPGNAEKLKARQAPQRYYLGATQTGHLIVEPDPEGEWIRYSDWFREETR